MYYLICFGFAIPILFRFSNIFWWNLITRQRKFILLKWLPSRTKQTSGAHTLWWWGCVIYFSEISFFQTIFCGKFNEIDSYLLELIWFYPFLNVQLEKKISIFCWKWHDKPFSLLTITQRTETFSSSIILFLYCAVVVLFLTINDMKCFLCVGLHRK